MQPRHLRLEYCSICTYILVNCLIPIKFELHCFFKSELQNKKFHYKPFAHKIKKILFTFPNFSQNDVQIAHDIAHCEFEPWYKVIIFLYHDTRGTYWYHGSGIIDSRQP